MNTPGDVDAAIYREFGIALTRPGGTQPRHRAWNAPADAILSLTTQCLYLTGHPTQGVAAPVFGLDQAGDVVP